MGSAGVATIQTVCVYCSSSERLDRHFREAARLLGRELARRELGLVYGGGSVGLMGEVAREAQAGGARVTGVIPEFMKERELAYEAADELIITDTMRERKQRMEELADAFLVLPGGFGTLEEVIEIITLKQLERHAKPIVFLNQAGFYDPLFAFFERLFDGKFARESYRALYHAAEQVEEALSYLEKYREPEPGEPWFRVS